MTLIQQTMEYAKEVFANDFSGHDYFHTLRVYNLAIQIAKSEKADEETVALAALLHDVDDVKLSPETAQHKENAVRFLREHHVDETKIAQIVQIIGEISFVGTDSIVPATIEGKCVQDADRLDAIGAIGIARCFSFGGSHHRVMYDPDEKPLLNMDEKQYRNHVSTTVNHFYEKLFLLKDYMNTATGKQLAKKRDEFMHQFMDEFYAEYNGEK